VNGSTAWKLTGWVVGIDRIKPIGVMGRQVIPAVAEP
jgi:hypothetical protein